MDSTLETRTSDITEHLTTLHSLVSSALTKAMKAFEDLDIDLANEAISVSDQIEELHHLVEDRIFDTVSKHQPTGTDLRRLITYSNASSSLHKIGRYANKIMKIVELCEGLDHFKEIVSLPYLAELAISAIDVSMRAVFDEDLSEIDEIEKLEAQSDSESVDMFEEIAEYLGRRKDISQLAMYYIIVGRYYERAADQALRIAESAIFTITGERRKLGLVYKEESESMLD
ncbi:MAG: phosphate signaling complex PhoU family protein [Candidatus Thorarchaeota archaeon]|jgi:phosphate transport system protein